MLSWQQGQGSFTLFLNRVAWRIQQRYQQLTGRKLRALLAFLRPPSCASQKRLRYLVQEGGLSKILQPRGRVGPAAPLPAGAASGSGSRARVARRAASLRDLTPTAAGVRPHEGSAMHPPRVELPAPETPGLAPHRPLPAPPPRSRAQGAARHVTARPGPAQPALPRQQSRRRAGRCRRLRLQLPALAAQPGPARPS